MTEGIKSNLYPCAHCEKTGTCTKGNDGTSCASCVKRNEISIFFRLKTYTGLLCGACGGIGQAEPLTERMNKRMRPLLAIVTVMILFALVFITLLTKNENFSTILAFAGTLIGSITGYYFSSNNTNNV